MENNNLTAVEWLEQKLKDRYSLIHSQPLFEQAKQMEKEQIIKAAKDADDSDFWVKYESIEQYYNETYGKKA